jgi:integration host factor subunit alpha
MVNRINTHKKDIINNIFNTIGIPSSYASKLVDELILIIISALITKKKLKIKNFGTFSLKKKKKRIGRNPKNKTIYEILERNVLTFKAAIRLNKKVNIGDKK